MSPRKEAAGGTRRPRSAEGKTILLSVAFGIAYGLVDALVDATFFSRRSLLEAAFTSVTPREMYTRASAVALILLFGLLMARVITRRKQREARLTVLQRMRDEVWQMSGPDDFVRVVEVLGEGLKALAIPAHGYAVNLVEGEDPPRVMRYAATTQNASVTVGLNEEGGERVLRMWRRAGSVYRPDILHSDPGGERAGIEEHFGEGVRSVLDVPFSHGTLAVNSRVPDAFSPDRIQALEDMAQVVTSGCRRMEDLRRLEQSNAELRETNRLLDAFREIGDVALGTLDLDELLDNLAQQIVRAGIFRSLMVALVDERQECVEVVRSFVCESGSDGLPVPGADIVSYPEAVGMKYALDDDNITARVARSGEMAVLDGRDEADGDPQAPAPRRSVAFFVPVKRGGQTLAVLATACLPRHREEIQARIRAMQPLLGQVAVALEHARLYEASRREIAEHRRLEREVTRLERQRATWELAAGVSHNLNNMLTAILGPAQLLLRKSDDPGIRREAEAILTAARRARDLVMRLGEAVRSQHQGPLEAVSLAGQVRRVLEASLDRLQREVTARGGALEVVTELADTPAIRGNPARLEEIILQLLLNAVTAMPEGGTLTIATGAVEAGIQLTVRDTGTGMDEETRRRVFEPFFTTKPDVGRGLGMSTVYGLVKGWGGTIDVESAPGRGTIFSVCFSPWNDEAAPAGVRPAPAGEAGRGRCTGTRKGLPADGRREDDPDARDTPVCPSVNVR